MLTVQNGIRCQVEPDSQVAQHPQRFLLLHGNPDRLETWDRFVAHLLRRQPAARVCRLDLPGFGASAAPSQEAWDLGSFAEVVLQTCERVGWSDGGWVVIGHSHGGAVAIEFAHRFPNKVKLLVLVAPVSATEHGSYRILRSFVAGPVIAALASICGSPRAGFLARLVVKTLLKTAYAPQPIPQGEVAADLAILQARPELLKSMRKVVTAGPCVRIAEIVAGFGLSPPSFPTLVLHGTADRLVPLRCSESLRGLPRAEIVPVPGGGHMLPQTHVEQVLDQILSRL